jgi:hypothetical protein
MDADPADSVREVLEKADSPMSTSEIVQALSVSDKHQEHEIAQSLDFWRREHHAVVEDDEGKWIWQGGPGLD